MIRNALLLITLLLAPALAVAQSVFVVRHAERADAGMMTAAGADPDLSDAGRARAESLASVLKDARIARIYVSQFKRARQTAEPLAASAGIIPTTVAADDIAALVGQVNAGKGHTLIVGHSNTIPQILKALGVAEQVTIGDAEHDHLFVVAGEPPVFVRLRYR